MLLTAMLYEHNFISMDRNWQMKRKKEDDGKYVEHIDFETGNIKRVKVENEI